MRQMLKLIETYPASYCAEAIILMRRLAYLKATLNGLSEMQLDSWRDVETRAAVIEQLNGIQRLG